MSWARRAVGAVPDARRRDLRAQRVELRRAHRVDVGEEVLARRGLARDARGRARLVAREAVLRDERLRARGMYSSCGERAKKGANTSARRHERPVQRICAYRDVVKLRLRA